MDTKEKILTLRDKFFQSKEYLGLKKELEQLIPGFFTEERGEDIKPLADDFDKEAAGYGMDAIARNKLFWGLVAENLKDSEFRKIHTEIGPLLDDAERAEQFLNKKLVEIIERLSPAIYRNLNSRADALKELKARFYSYWPEISDLIISGLEGKKAKTSAPAGQLGEDDFAKTLKKVFGNKQEPRWLLEKNWEVPSKEEIKPGLVVEILDVDENKVHKYLILTEPYNRILIGLNEKSEDFSVKAREIGGGGYEIERDIAEWGLAPQVLRGGGVGLQVLGRLNGTPTTSRQSLKIFQKNLKNLI